ncbi:MAG: CxxC-x17-CxxC domain-containing protein [Patescibacteria group bacterium]
MDDSQGFGQRKMYQGNWTCAGCGAQITELPFEPDGTRPVYCRDCHRQRRNNRTGGGGGRRRDF